MRYCPTCQTEFDEDIIRFCTKDGTPLVDDKKPTFTDNLPSETSSNDDIDDGAETIIRRKSPQTNVTPRSSEKPSEDTSAEVSPKTKDPNRIVISTSDEKKKEQGIRSKKQVGGKIPPPPPQKSNTALIVAMTMFGTVALLAGTFGVWYFLTSQTKDDANKNLSVNENLNINADLNANPDGNFNLGDFNLNTNLDANNSNMDLNLNLNINTKTPSPTPTPTPTKTPPPSTPETNTNTNENVNANTSTPTPTKTTTPTPVKTPPPPPPLKTPTPNTNTNRPVNAGTLNGRAVRLPTPTYPAAARQAKASGRVTVSVTVDENGDVISAKATSGHPLLLNPAETAAKRSKFRPVSINGNNTMAVGTVVYNFVN